MTYLDKLKDPKWQKKRLLILQRDEFTCQNCFSDKETLHVHHLIYSDGSPWDIDDKHLITLCENCHKSITEEEKEYKTLLIDSVKGAGFMGDDLRELAEGFHSIKNLPHISGVVASVINYFVKHYLSFMVDEYFKHLSKSNVTRNKKGQYGKKIH